MIHRLPIFFFFLVSLFIILGTILVLRPSRPLYRMARALPVALVSLVGCGAVGLGYLRRQARIAKAVVHRLHSGDLKARLPEHRLARFGGLVSEFNGMADDIESLVSKLRDSERQRAETVREIAHDVRTPLTSLRLSVESGKLSAAGAEIAYLQELIDGLLLLAQIQDHDFRAPGEPFDLAALLRAETDRLQDMPDRMHLEFRFVDESSGQAWLDSSRLLMTRALRNALENAARFARAKVTVTLTPFPERWEILIADDGPGFSKEALASFGIRRPVRPVEAGSSSRLSVGLGTVIVKRVIEASGGKVVASNGSGGAEVRVLLPRRRTLYSDRESMSSVA